MKLPVRWNMKEGSCEAYRISGAGSSALHGHQHFLITYIISGEGVQTLNGREIPFGKGDLFVLSPADFHINEVRDPKGYDYYGVKLSVDIIEALPSSLYDMRSFPIHLKLSQKTERRASQIFEALVEECREGMRTPARDVMIRALATELFVLILRENPRKEAGACGDFVNYALAYLYSHLHEQISVSDAAARIGYSPNYFNSLFLQSFGKPFAAYLRKMRLEYAKNLLIAGRASLTEIALESGFSSLAHFSHLFKKEYGVSASEWRTLCGKEKP